MPKVSALGAERICPLGLGDDDDDLDGDFERWRETLWAALCPGGGGGGGGGAPFTLAAPAAQFEAEWLGGDAAVPPPTLSFLARCQPKHSLHELRVATNRELASQPQHGSVRHLELDLACSGGAPCAYATADDLAVCPDNGPALAAKLASRLGLAPAATFALRPRPSAAGGAAPPLPTPCSVEQALRDRATHGGARLTRHRTRDPGAVALGPSLPCGRARARAEGAAADARRRVLRRGVLRQAAP